VVATSNPPATPASFAQRSALLQRTPGQPLSAAQASTLSAQRQPQQGAASNVRLATSSTASGTAAVAQDRAFATGPAPRERSAQTLPGRVDAGAPGSAVHGAPLRSSTYAHAGVAQQNERIGTGATQGGAARNPQVANLQQEGSRRGLTQSAAGSSSPLASSRSAHPPVQHGGGPTTSHSSSANSGRATNPSRAYASRPPGTAPSYAQGHAAGNSHAPPVMREGPRPGAPASRGYGYAPPPQGQRGPNAPRQVARQGPGKQKGGDNGGPPH
jgi:hypothetical protein